MADASQLEFDKRLRKINKQHRKLAHGYVTSINHDGLIIARPRPRSFAFPYRGLFMSFLVLLCFKAYIFGSLGEAGYLAKVERLNQGNAIEQAGAFIMKPEPATLWIASQIRNVMPDRMGR